MVVTIMSKDTLTNRDIVAIERRKQILDIAKRLFAANGYHATSMRVINKAVGMSEALTYHYFPGGKLEIFNTIIREVEEERSNNINKSIEAFSDNISVKEALMLLVKEMSKSFIKDKEFFQIMIQDRKLINQDQMDFLSLAGQQFIDPLIDFLARRATQGQLRIIDFSMAVSQFMCHIGLVALKQIMYEDDFNDENFIQNVRKIIDFTVELWSI